MLVGLIIFGGLSLVALVALILEIFDPDKVMTASRIGASIGVLGFSALFFGLAWACGYMIKRCFD